MGESVLTSGLRWKFCKANAARQAELGSPSEAPILQTLNVLQSRNFSFFIAYSHNALCLATKKKKEEEKKVIMGYLFRTPSYACRA